MLKIYKGQTISKKESLHSNVSKHLDMHSPTITETVHIVKKGKKERNKANQLKKEALV